MSVVSIAAICSAVASVATVIITFWRKRNADQAERETNIREIPSRANKVMFGTMEVQDIVDKLMAAYQSRLASTDDDIANSQFQAQVEELECSLQDIPRMRASALYAILVRLQSLKSKELKERLMELDAHLAHLERMKYSLLRDLASSTS